MKITRDPIRKPQPLTAELAEAVQHIINDDQDQIKNWTNIKWNYSRGDLFQYVAVLNRFDTILETTCRDYELNKGIQTKPFNSNIKELLLSVLKFSKLLFDNCNNRNLYNSYEHLNNLLNTTDVDVLEGVLRLMLKPAQRVNNPRAVQSSFLAHQDKITELARGGSIVDLTSTNPVNSNNVTMSFYKTGAGKDEGLQTIDLIAYANQKTDHDMFWQLVKEYQIPKEYHFELLNRVRITNHSNDMSVKQKLLIIRFISIVIMAHTMSDTIAQNRVFVYEPQLVPQIAQLVSYDNEIPIDIQTYALYALDGIARHRTKVTEVLAAFNASTNHGILLHILRQLYRVSSNYTEDFIDALFTLLSFLVQTTSGGTMLMSAGIMSTLIQVMNHPENSDAIYRKSIIKAIGLLDLIMNNIHSSFSSFCSANGIEVLLAVIQAQVDFCIHQSLNNQTPNPDSLSLVKNSLRFLIRMMESSDTADGLRNLVESSVPHTIKKVLEHADVFGPSIFALVVNVTTTFIHNEPTSLSVIQEIQVPQTFLKMFNKYNTSSFEVLLSAVHAFGAICLNTAGLQMFNEADPLPHFFELLTAPSFVSNTYDVGSAPALGTTMDELIRHHPSLKVPVFTLINRLMMKVTEVGNSEEGKPSDNRHQLLTERREPTTEKSTCLILGYVDLVARFLEGFLRNNDSIKQFVNYNGLELLLRYYDLPALPYDYSITTAFDSLNYVFRLVSEYYPIRVAEVIEEKVRESSAFISVQFGKNKTCIDCKPGTTNFHNSNALFRKLSVLFGHIGLLSTVFASAILTNSKHSGKLVNWCVSERGRGIITLLGDIHRAMVWQNILLRESVPASWYKIPHDLKTDNKDVDLGDPYVVNVTRFKLLLSEMPPALMPVFQGLIKVSVSRRTTTVANLSLGQMAKMVAHDLAMLFSSSLRYMDNDAPTCKYDYYASMFSMISMLLLDDRNRSALETPLAVEFTNVGNVDYLIKTLFPQFWQAAEEQIKSNNQDKATLQRINTCIELSLAVFNHLGSSKLFHNSPHTTLIAMDGYGLDGGFNPYAWMTQMRLELSPLYAYLKSPVLTKFSRHVLHSLLKCVTQSLKGEGEASPRAKTFSTDDIIVEDIPHYETNHRVLVSMGFEPEQVETALRDFRYGICALDNLFSRRLVEHSADNGPPSLEISADLESSNPLTSDEYEAGLRILVNMWYDPSLAAESLSENNNLAQAALSLSQYNPSAIRRPNSSSNNEHNEQEEQGEEVVMEDDGDNEYEDVESTSDGYETLDSEDDESEDSSDDEVDNTTHVLYLKTLEKERSELRDALPPILARLVDERNDLDFEVRDLMIVCCCQDASHNEARTRQAISLFFSGINDIQDRKAKFEFAINKIRIFALMLRDPMMQEALPILISYMAEMMGSFNFLDLVVTYSVDSEPKWLATIFLILEASLAQLDEPKEEPASGSQANDSSSSPSIVTAEDRPKLLKYCIDLLKMKDLSQDNVIATLRIIVRLTKHHNLAVEFVETGGLEPLFLRPSTKFDNLKIQQAYIIMILRHIIECKSVVMERMHEWLSFWFTVPNARFLDVPTYIRNNSSLALRDPESFLDVSTQLCRLSAYNQGNLRNIRYIGDRADNEDDEQKSEAEEDKNEDDKQASSKNLPKEDKPPVPEVANNEEKSAYSHLVIHFLLNQLIHIQENGDGSNIQLAYTGFLLQCIFELVSSYTSCKYDIIYFGINSPEDASLSNHMRTRQSILYKLVNGLLSYNAIDASTDEERKKQSVSVWLASLLVAMCYEANHTKGTKKQQPQEDSLIDVKKHVLEVLKRSFKDALYSKESASDKYNRYFALTELCHCILNARPPTSLGFNIKEDSILVVAKLMLEKNFVPILISIIDNIDVNFPHAKMILNAVMKPLEQLTKFAIKIDNLNAEEEKKTKQKTIGSSTDAVTGLTGGDDNNEAPEDEEEDNQDYYIPMDTDEEEEDDASDEEVNHLYRNSSLAMFDGTALEEESSEESEEDVEMASSGEEIIEISAESDDDYDTVSGSEMDEAEEDEEMDEFMRSHRYHHSDTDEEEEGESEEDFDDDSSSESNILYTGSEYDSLTESVDSEEDEDGFESEDNQEGPWLVDEMDESQRNGRHGGHRHHRRHIIRAEALTDTDEDGEHTEPSDLDDDQESDDLDQEELEDVERNLTLFHRGARGDASQFISSIRNSLNNNSNGNNGLPRSFDRDSVILHPLLRSTNTNSNVPEGSGLPDTAILSVANSNHLQAYEDIIGGSAVRILENLLSQQQQRRNRASGQNVEAPTIATVLSTEPSTEANNMDEENKETLSVIKDFQPMQTADRWTQESQMVYTSPVAASKAAQLTNTLVNRLVEIAKNEKESDAEVLDEQDDEVEVIPYINIDANVENEDMVIEGSEENPEVVEIVNDDENEERVTVMVNGEEVDITGTGIDVEFLEALPDDLRAEVLSQQMAEREPIIESMETDEFNSAFLDALPADIREEILYQDSRDRNRRQNIQVSVEGGEEDAPNQPAITIDIPPTIFGNRNPSWGVTVQERDRHKNERRAMLHRDAVRIVDKQQLAILARLLFAPQSISKALLNRLLLNLCENSKTRSDLLYLLISVLQDGCTDLTAVDNTLSQLCSPKGKQSSVRMEKSESTKSISKTENAPSLITQRCLEILYYVVSWNDRSLAYFLTEHNSLSSKRRLSISGRKSKPKTDATPIKYPLLILIGLLDGPMFKENTTLLEQLMELLATVCKPIPSLVRKYNKSLEKSAENEDEKQHRAIKPPAIPAQYIEKIVDVFSSSECSKHTFKHTVSVLAHTSPLDSTLDIIIDSLTKTANECGEQIIIDLDGLYTTLDKLMPGAELEGSALSQFSATTSHQARLLRVLKSMDYLYTRKRNQSSNETVQNEKAVLEIYNKLDFVPLWKKLGDCLSLLQDREDLMNVASVLLPLIESFMAVSKYSSSKGYTAKTSETSPEEEFFLNFTDDHKKILNILVRNNPALMSGSFSLLIQNPKILEFDNKRNYFYQQLRKRTERREHYPPLRLTVRREQVFEDTYRRLQGLSGDEIRFGKLNVQFQDEEGVDAGGVAREWFSVLARQMFDPNYALFITSAADKLTYQPNRASGVNSEHLSYFKCVGRIIGKAIHDGRLLDAYFTRSFYKLILGRSVDYKDVEAIDPTYYKSLVWMLENDITDIIDLTFSVETDDFGTTKIIDLKPNGRDIPVTEENKHEYVNLVSEQRLYLAIKDQVNAFIEGFNDIIPRELIQIFNEQELELLISGLPDIDIDEWKANTVYVGYTLSSPQIQWFWRAVRSFDQEERAKLLQFSTGTSKVPLEGFAQLQGSNGVQKFQIHKEFSDVNRLPSAHTCFNQIDLPQYLTYEDLRANLFKAINECSTGFAFQ